MEVRKMIFRKNYKHNSRWGSVTLENEGLERFQETLRQDTPEV
jgi:hypothetical protein